jgi:hypothetical protein
MLHVFAGLKGFLPGTSARQAKPNTEGIVSRLHYKVGTVSRLRYKVGIVTRAQLQGRDRH